MSNAQHFELETIGDVCVVRLRDPRLLDQLIVREVDREVLECIDREQPLKMVVNFAAVTHCSTEVITTMLRIKRRLMKSAGHLALSGMSQTIREVYRLMVLDGTVFTIYDQTSEAIAALQKL